MRPDAREATHLDTGDNPDDHQGQSARQASDSGAKMLKASEGICSRRCGWLVKAYEGAIKSLYASRNGEEREKWYSLLAPACRNCEDVKKKKKKRLSPQERVRTMTTARTSQCKGWESQVG